MTIQILKKWISGTALAASCSILNLRTSHSVPTINSFCMADNSWSTNSLSVPRRTAASELIINEGIVTDLITY